MKDPNAEDDDAEAGTHGQMTSCPAVADGTPAPVSQPAGDAWVSGVMVLARDGFPFLDKYLAEYPGARPAPAEPEEGGVLAPARTRVGPPMVH